MAYAYGTYPANPPYYDYIRTPPSAGAHYTYATPGNVAYAGDPSRPQGSPKHARRASHHYEQPYSARVPPHFGAYASRFATPPRSTPLRSDEYVSGGFDYSRAPPRRPRCSSARVPKMSSDWRYVYNVFADDDYYEQYYENRDAPPPYERHQSYARADHRYYYDQVPQYAEAEPTTPKANTARPRRASHASRPHPSPPKRPSTAKSSPRKASDDDARRAGIPAGYSIKNWDPTEEPIILLGSVFDANSLGKWIYDWTVYSYGPATPMTDVAGDLWLLLIQLAGKVKRADETIEKIRQEESRELVEDFLESGERLWVRFKKLLKICEDYMWRAAQRETGEKRPASMGKDSGCEFVDSIFGRDRELDKTEKLMSAIRLWSMRFDANCDEILRNPAA